MLPHELVARYIAPLIKALIAHSLVNRGFSQERVARLLGVSQPMISKYLRRSKDNLFTELKRYGINPEEAASVVDLLAALLERGSIMEYYNTFTSYINTVLARGDLCDFHRELEPRLLQGCDICRQAFTPVKDVVVTEVDDALRKFLQHPKAYMIIPNVGSNIVAAKRDARRVSDVVGLSGGIVRVGNKVVAIGSPVYGGSKHTAQILLKVLSRWPRKRAAMVIAYSDKCLEILRSMGLRIVVTGPHEIPERLFEEIEVVLNRVGEEPDVIADRGGYGLEPVMYILGYSATQVVNLVIKCLDEL